MNSGSTNINLLSSFYGYKNLALASVFVFVGFIFFVGADSAQAATAGPFSSSTQYSNLVGCDPSDQDWANQSGASGSDDDYASTDAMKSNWCTYFFYLEDFGFNIPTGATIDGIEVNIEKKSDVSGTVQDQYLSMLDASTPVGSNYADSAYWLDYDSITNYGGASDLWGSSWTPSTINNAGFGVILYAMVINDNGNASIDDVNITVHYTPATYTCQSITSGNGNWNASGSWTSCGGGTPGSADTAVINGTANITVTASTTVAALKFGTTAAAATAAVLKVDSGQTLTVTGTTTMVGTAGTATQATIQNGTGSGTFTTNLLYIGETVTPSSTVTNKLISTISNLNVIVGEAQPVLGLTGYANGASYNNPSFELQSGILTTKTITTSLPNASNTATVTMATGSQNATMILTGATPWNISGTGTTTTTLNGTGSTVEYSGTNAAIRNTTYTGLKVSGNAGTTAQTATVAGVLTVTGAGTMTPSSGTITLNNGASISNSGTLTFYNLTIASGATVTGNTSYTVAGTLTNSSTGTFTASSGTQTFNNGSIITNSGTQLTFYNLTVAASATVTANTSYTVAGVLTVSGSATLSPTSGTITLSGSGTPLSVTGTFSPSGSNTVSYTGTSATNIRIGTYYNLDFSPASGTPTYTAGAGSLTINGSLTLAGAGAATVNFDTSDPTVDVNGSITIGAGDTLIASASGTFTIGGSFANSGNFNHSNGTVTFDGAGSNTVDTRGAYGLFYNVIFNNAGDQWTLSNSAMFVSSVLTITAGNLNSGGQPIILTANGTPFVNNDTFTQGTGRIQYEGTSVNVTALNGSGSTNAYYNLWLGSYGEIGASTYTMLGSTTVTNILDIGQGLNGVDTLVLGSTTLTLKGSGTPLVVSTDDVVNSGTSTIQYTSGSGITKLASKDLTGSNKFYNLTINGSGTFTAGVNYEVGGTLSVVSGTFNGTSYTTTMNNGSVITNSGTLTFGNLTIATSATVTANTSYTVAGTLTVSTSATLAPTSGTITLSGTGTPLSISGTFTPSSSNTVQYTGSTATVTAATFHNLTLGSGSAGTYTMPATTTTIKGNLSVSNNATVTKGEGTLVLSGTSTQTISDSNGTKQDLGAIQASNTTDAWCNISSTACNSSWLARRKITFDNSALSGSLTNFPVLVSVTSSQINYAKTQNRGQDIRFVDADGTTALSYEIEKWDESGTSLIWVKVPTLSNNNTDYIYMYYHNTTATDNQSVTSVWDTNHKGVWHLATDTSLSTSDSTTNGNNGNNTSASATTGKVDGGASYNGTTSKIIAPATSSLNIGSGSGITMSTWVNPSAVAGFVPILEYGNSANYGVHLWNYPSSGKLYLNVKQTNGTDHQATTTGTPLTASAWQHLTVTYNSSTGAVAIYHNGTSQSLDSSNLGAFTPQTSYDFNIGHRPNAGGPAYFAGSMDEVRVSDVVRSADWVKADYNSTNNTMNGFGTEDVYGATGLTLGSSIKATSVTVDSGKIFSLGGSNTLTLTGNGASVFAVSGTFVPSTGTVEFASASTSGTTIPALTYYGLTLNKASNTFTAAGSITAYNLFISAGSFVAPSTTLTVSFFNNYATFTHNSGTVVFVPPSNSAMTAGIENNATTTFNNVSVTTPGLTLQITESNTIVFAGTLTVAGSNGNPILIRSGAGDEQWFATFNTLPVLSYLNLIDSGCSGGLTAARSATVYNQGNNGSCWGFAVYGSSQGSSGGGAGSGGSSSGGGGQSGGGGSSGGGGGAGGGSNCSTTATGTATIFFEGVLSVTMVCNGSGYSSAPTVTFTGGGGSGATGTAVLTNGAVTSVTINNGGSNYSTEPTVTFSAPSQGGGGGGASP